MLFGWLCQDGGGAMFLFGGQGYGLKGTIACTHPQTLVRFKYHTHTQTQTLVRFKYHTQTLVRFKYHTHTQTHRQTHTDTCTL
eukprot:COSAG06_NODE_7744_length_2391_cov_9.362129_2_plen_83_part_00